MEQPNATPVTPKPLSDSVKVTGQNELLPCVEYLRQMIFNCDPATGSLTWRPGKHRTPNQRAGSVDSKGRLRVEIDGRSYAVASVIWAIHYGTWPKTQLDHRNRERTDNRITNLRQATNQQNSFNRANHKGKSLPKGVSFHRGRYTSRITVSGVTRNLGSYATADEAGAAYRKASAQLHGEYSCNE